MPFAERPYRLPALLAGAAMLAACSGKPAERVLPALPPLATLAVTAADGAAAAHWDGVVQAVQSAELAAQTSGRVTDVAVDVNDRVEAGAVLLRLSQVEQQSGAAAAQAQLRAADAAAAEADAAFRRAEAVAARHLIAAADLDLARATRDRAVAARDAARAQLAQAAQQTDYTVVRAPFAGVVSRRFVEPGETVAPGTPLLSLFAPGALRVQVDVPQAVAAALRGGHGADLQLADGRRVSAARVTVFPAADSATHTVAVRLDLPALDPPPAPGTTSSVQFPDADGPDGHDSPLRIPASAVVRRGELAGAYVLADGRLQLRQLRLGRRDSDSVDVIAGLHVGDAVVRDGAAAVAALAAQRGASAHE